MTRYDLRFERRPLARNKRTFVWDVYGPDGSPLGVITWKNTWRRYTFATTLATTWDAQCLRQLTEFLDARMAERKDAGFPDPDQRGKLL